MLVALDVQTTNASVCASEILNVQEDLNVVQDVVYKKILEDVIKEKNLPIVDQLVNHHALNVILYVHNNASPSANVKED